MGRGGGVEVLFGMTTKNANLYVRIYDINFYFILMKENEAFLKCLALTLKGDL